MRYSVLMRTSEHLPNIVKNIRAKMDAEGINGIQLGKRTGLSRNVIYMLLKGESRSPGLTTLEAVASALGVTLTELISENEELGAKAELERKISSLSPEDQERAMMMLEFLIRDGARDSQRKD